MPRQAIVQDWPSQVVLGICFRQLETMSICKVRDRLEWLLEVYPGCAILIVRDAHRLPEGLCHAVLRCGHDNLWPGNYDATGLQDLPPGVAGPEARRHGSGSAGSGRAWLEQGVAEKGQKGEGAKGNEGKSKKGKNGKKGGGKKGKGNQ